MKNIKFRPKIGQFPTRPNQPPARDAQTHPKYWSKPSPMAFQAQNHPKTTPKRARNGVIFWVILTQPKNHPNGSFLPILGWFDPSPRVSFDPQG